MKNGKKIKKYSFSDDLESYIMARGLQPPTDSSSLECVAAGYLVALGETTAPASELLYWSGNKEPTRDPLNAYWFDKWLDAVKWMLENCEITQPDTFPPRGLERPRFPRVCFMRTFVEIKQI